MTPTSVAKRYAGAAAETQRVIDRLLEQDADDRAWAEQIGPAFRQGDVALLLAKSKQAVSADGRLLRLDMRDGSVGYPALQFDGGRPLVGISEIIALLGPVVATPWTIASWLTSPTDELDGRRPLDALRAGEHAEILPIARRAARALAS